ncbi:phosphate/phosphite/phosphonate ABC transporter substrate-binding protein [Fibrobacterales bacterium]|nr:phosphate/phosphite/phosphonate ABC transporter substrate-binding protein [Fibrobacterales bacterium]
MKSSILFFLFSISFIFANKERVYTIGVVPQFEARILASNWKDISDYLNKKTGLRFEFKGSPDIQQFERSFMKGEYDLVYMNPYHFIIGEKAQGYIPIVRDHSKKLQGVLVVSKESSINKVDDLEGLEVAFPSPNALGASLQMRQEIADYFKIKIKPIYVKTHSSVYLNVLTQNTQAGGGVHKTLLKEKKEYQENLKIIHKTQAVAPHPIAVHPRVTKEDLEVIKATLLSMNADLEGKSLLNKIPIKTIGKAQTEDYSPLKSMKLERFYIFPKAP